MLDFLFLDVGQVYPNLIRFNLGWRSSGAIQTILNPIKL